MHSWEQERVQEVKPSIGTSYLYSWLVVMSATTLFITALYGGWIALSATLLLGVSIFAIVTASRKLGILSWGAGIPAFYALFFIGLPLVSRLVASNAEPTDTAMADALFVASLGLLAYCAGASAMRLVRKPASGYDLCGLLRLDVSRRPEIILMLIVVGAISLLWSYAFGYFGLIPATGAEASDAAGAISAIGFLLTVAHVMAWNGFFSTGNRRLMLYGVLSTSAMLGFGLLANSKTQIVLPFFLIALCLWGASGRFPLKLSLVSLLVYVFIAFPFVTASRFALQATDYAGSRYELAEVVVDYLLSNQWMADAVASNATESLGRGLLTYFAQIVHQAGNTVDFMVGRTFAHGFEGLVPRFLYPDKPDMNIGNWTGQAFGVIDPRDEVTNISPTYMGEFYMNFGLAGVVLGMFLVGVIAILVDRYLIVERHSWTMPIIVPCIGWQESTVGHTILPFIKNAALWVPVLLLVVYFLQGTTGRQQRIAPNS